MSEIKDKVKELLNKVNRPGMKELMDFLEKSDYYEAPASTKYHGAYKCGLIKELILKEDYLFPIPIKPTYVTSDILKKLSDNISTPPVMAVVS